LSSDDGAEALKAAMTKPVRTVTAVTGSTKAVAEGLTAVARLNETATAG
jgi:hypothetical protein